jgi:type VI secretion system protein ImpE
VWTPAFFTWVNGGEIVGLIPTRYPGSQASEDAALQLSHKTEWLEPADGVYIGMGQRLLASDVGEHSLLDVRVLRLGEEARPLDEFPATESP